METMKVYLIDDEINSLEAIAEMIRIVAPDVQIIGKSYNPLDGLEQLRQNPPDLLFLDVQMPHLTGFQLLEKLGKIDFDVVFTTAYDQYAIQAFKVSATDYLLKPIDMDELERAIEKVRQRRRGLSEFSAFEKLFQQVQSKTTEPRRLALPTLEGLIFLPFDDILYLQSDSNYTTFYTLKKERIVVSRTLKEYEEILERHHFFRVHNSYIINILQIQRYVRGDGGAVIMSNGTEIEVSRRRKDDFVRKLEDSVAG